MTSVSRDDLVIIFETHATSLDNESGLASGWFDVALSATGEEQARRLGVRRRDDELAAVFCSDLTRSWHTAQLAFADRDVPIMRDTRLRECNYGALTRRPTLEIEAQRAAYISRPFPDGESYEQVAARVSDWLAEISNRFWGHTVLLIGHRAIHHAFEHLVRHVPMNESLSAPWQWQPGWTYRVQHPDIRSSTFPRLRPDA